MTKNEAQAVVAIIGAALRLEGESNTADQLAAAVEVMQEPPAPQPQSYPATVGGLVRLVRDLGVSSVRADEHAVTVDSTGADLEARRQRVWDTAFASIANGSCRVGYANYALETWDREHARAMPGPLPRPLPTSKP